MRLISASVNARRFDSAVDLSSLTRTAGLTVSNPCRTASPRQIRNTFTPEFGGRAREFFRLTITKPGNVARLQRREVAFAFRFAEKTGEPFDHALVTRVRGFLRLDRFGFQPCLAPRFDGRARQRFDVGRSENVADTLRDHFARSVHAQLAVARFERGLVPRTADFERLLFVAGFRGAKTRLLVWVSGFQIENAQNQYGLPG